MRRHILMLVTVCAVMGVTGTVAAQISVGTVGCGRHADTMRDSLNRIGMQATSYQVSSVTLTQMRNHQVVLVATDGCAGSYRNQLGDRMASYVDGGGNIASAVFNQQSTISIGGRWESGGYRVVNILNSNVYSTGSLGTVHMPNHPVMQGISSVGVRTYRTGNAPLASGAFRIADYHDGQILAAARENKAGRIVFIGFYPVESFRTLSGNAFNLFTNSVTWAAQGGGNSNQPPTITNPGNKEAVENAAFTLQITASDPDADDLLWNATGLPSGLSIGQSGKITGQPANGTAGVHNVSVTVSDGEEERGVNFTITVYNDVDPTVAFTGPTEAWHGAAVTVTGTIVEAGCNKTPSLQASGVTGYTVSGSNGTWSFTKSGVGAGRYVPARVIVTSTCTGRSTTVDRKFGVDLGDPTILLAQSALNQNGVNPNDSSTWPAINAYAALALGTRASDSVSGIRSVSALVERTDNNAQTTIYGATFTLSGTPSGGQAAQVVAACNEDAYCTDNSELNLATLSGSSLVLKITATDAAGRSATSLYYFTTIGLRAALVAWRDAVPQSSDVTAAQTRLNNSRAALNAAIAAFDAEVYGNITLATQTAQSNLLAAKTLDNSLNLTTVNARGTTLADVLTGFLGARVSNYISNLGERSAFATANGFVGQARDGDDTGTRLNLLANAFFWMEDGANPMVAEDFVETQTLLGRIINEQDDYITYDPALVARAELAEARTNLAAVKVLVDRVVANGDTSISDLEHVQLLLGLTNTAENVKESQAQGAWVRNWQWGLTQIVYVYARRALNNARDFIGPFHPVFTLGQNELDTANTYREARRADDFMNLLINSRCLTIAIYNKAYNPDVEAPSACCEALLTYRALDQSFPVQRSCTNTAPTVTDPGAQSGNVNAQVSLAIQATDADGDTLTYSATGLPPGLSINSQSGVISGTISSGPNSPYTVRVTVTDGVAPTSVSFQWTVIGGGGATYSQSFTQGGRYSRDSEQCSAWHTWVAELGQIQSFSKVTLRGSRNTEGYSCNGSQANQICGLLARPVDQVQHTSFNCDGKTWWVGRCGDQLEVAVGTTAICRCTSENNIGILRPCIDEGGRNPNWGGIDGNTCNGPSQSLEVVCE